MGPDDYRHGATDHDESQPPSWYWWVVNVYQPGHRDMLADMRTMEHKLDESIARLEKLLWAVMIAILSIGGTALFTVIIDHAGTAPK